ncbi:MAG: hypothetical protein EOM73_17505, partial [Bacteroidia bacterium]|nr:hypothetical protein [Bacteroidia bacterium]
MNKTSSLIVNNKKRVLYMFISPEIQKPDMNKTEISRFLFGQNLEHTRACIYGGLSAQLLKNRKFAGKPSRIGVAAEWEPFGKDTFYELSQHNTYTRHSAGSNTTMYRLNELGSQRIQHFSATGIAGIRQTGLSLCAGKHYIFRIAIRENNAESCPVRLDIRTGEKLIFEAQTEIHSSEWEVREFRFSCNADTDVEVRIGMTTVNSLEIGMASLLDSDNWHGMRRDVVEHLRSIGTTLIRWPGGNFAGEYRWRDGLLDVDRRAPLQSATEIETQPYSAGFDNHELNTDDIVALCREIGAE